MYIYTEDILYRSRYIDQMSRPPGYWITSQHHLRLDWQADLVMCPCSVRRDGVAELNQRNDDDDDDDILL